MYWLHSCEQFVIWQWPKLLNFSTFIWIRIGGVVNSQTWKHWTCGNVRPKKSKEPYMCSELARNRVRTRNGPSNMPWPVAMNQLSTVQTYMYIQAALRLEGYTAPWAWLQFQQGPQHKCVIEKHCSKQEHMVSHVIHPKTEVRKLNIHSPNI